MPERGGSKPNLTNLHWADGGAAEVIEPGEGRKTKGHELYKPRHEHFNWLQNKFAAGIAWMQGAHVRYFDTLEEAIAATEPQEVFGLVRNTGSQVGSTSYTWGVAGNFADVATDGERLYYAVGTHVVAVQRDGTTELWTRDLGATVLCVCADGSNVFAGTVAQVAGELYQLNRDSGVVLQSREVGANVVDVASDGVDVAFAYNFFVEVREVADLTSLTGVSTNHGATVTALCIDQERIVLGGFAGTGGSALRSFIRPGSGSATNPMTSDWTKLTSTVRDLVSDGLLLFAGLNASANHLLCIDKTGATVWQKTVSSGNSIAAVAVDERYVYSADGGALGSLSALDRYTGALVMRLGTSGVVAHVAVDCDGLFVATSISLYRRSVSRGQELFTRVAPTFFHSPFPQLAVPLSMR